MPSPTRVLAALAMIVFGFIGMATYRVGESLYDDWAFLHMARLNAIAQAAQAQPRPAPAQTYTSTPGPAPTPAPPPAASPAPAEKK